MRFARFAIAGTGGFVVQVGTLAALTSLAGVHYLIATAIAVEAAILSNFAWHQLWTWRDRPGSIVDRLVRFNVLAGVTSIFGSIFLTATFVEVMGWHPIAANVISVMMLSVVNFVGADRLVFRGAAVALAVGLASTASAEDGAMLQPKTARDFANYAAAVEARSAASLAGNAPFLAIERQSAAEQARILALLRRGEIHVERAAAARDGSQNEIAIDGGTINHWRGTVFIAGVSLDHVLKVLQDPNAPLHKQEDVLSYKVVPKANGSQHLYIRLKRTKFVTVVYDTEYDVQYRKLAADRAVSTSISTKIQEIQNAGTPRERALPEGNDSGYMWRLNSYWRYKQVDGGVLVEVESLTLSRDLPALVGPLIRPIVNSTARESMTRTLASLRDRFRA
jgi:putative flippase GtrA